MKNLFKKFIIKILDKKGYAMVSSKNIRKFTMEACIARCIERGIEIKTVIDIGASNGSWSEMCIKHFPDAFYLLIEAQADHLIGLEQFKEKHSNSDFLISAAGKRSGIVYFDNSSLFGGKALETKPEKNCIEVPVTTIDHEVKTRKLEPPFLIKLDTHGYEVPILDGAAETIKSANLVIIETYNFKIAPESLRYFEMNKYMEEKGFSSIEIADLMLRLKDNSLWQMDTFYIPSSSKEYSYTSYV